MADIQTQMAIEDGISPHLYAGMSVDQIVRHREFVKNYKARTKMESAVARAKSDAELAVGVERYVSIRDYPGDDIVARSYEGFDGVTIMSSDPYCHAVVRSDELEQFGNWLLSIAERRRRWLADHRCMSSTPYTPQEILDMIADGAAQDQEYAVDLVEDMNELHSGETKVDVARQLLKKMRVETIMRFKRGTAPDIGTLRDLIRHCWVHSGYRNCGRDQMTTEQKTIYDSIIGRDRPRIEVTE